MTRIFAIHGMAPSIERGRFAFRNLCDVDTLGRFLSAVPPLLSLSDALASSGCALTIDDATKAGGDAALLARSFCEAMKTLPDAQRTILQLKLWDGLTFEEIAHAQGIPLNTAASRYRYALEKMRTLLRPLYEEMQ